MSIQQRPYPFSGSASDNKYSTAVDSSLSLHTSKSHLHSYLKRGLGGQVTNRKDLNVSMGDEEGLVHHHHHRVSSSLTTTTSTTTTTATTTATTTPTTTPSPSLPSLSSSSSTPSMSLTSVTSEDGPDASGNGCGNGLFEENEKGLIDHQFQDQKHCMKVGNENDNDSDNEKDKVSTSTSTTTITQLGLRLDQMQLPDNITITKADSDGDGVVREQEQEYEAGPSTASTSIGLLSLQSSSSSPSCSTTSSASSSTSSLPTISNSPPIITTTTTTTITITSASTPNLHESVSSANVIALSVSSDNDSGSGNTNGNGNGNGDRNASTSLRSLLRPRQVSDFTGQHRLQEQQNSLNVKFAPLPELEPRKRKSNTPLGMAAKRQIARRRADPGMFDQEGVYWSQEEFDSIKAVQEQRVLQQEHPDLTPEELAMKEERIKKKEERRREKDREREERRLKKDEERQAKEVQTDPFVAAVKKMSVISRTMWKKMSNKDLKGLSEEEMREEEEWKKKRKEYKRKQRERHANQKASLVARYEIPEKPADEEQGEGRVWIEEVGEPYRKMQELRAKESIDSEPIILNSEPSSPNVVE